MFMKNQTSSNLNSIDVFCRTFLLQEHVEEHIEEHVEETVPVTFQQSLLFQEKYSDKQKRKRIENLLSTTYQNARVYPEMFFHKYFIKEA